MTAPAPLDQAWNYPLFEALYRRRSRRFGLGFEMPEGPFRYKSAHAPFRSPNWRKRCWSVQGPDSPDLHSGTCRRRHLTLAAAGAPTQ